MCNWVAVGSCMFRFETQGRNAIMENLDGCFCQISPLSITFLWLLLGQWVLQRREELIT